MRCLYENYTYFKLMFSKSFRKTRNHKMTYVTAVLMPVLLSIIVIVLRTVNKPTIKSVPADFREIDYDVWWTSLVTKITHRRERMINERPNFVSNVFIPKIMLGYAPNTTIGIQKLIMGVIRSISLKPTQVSSYADCDELRIRAYSEQYIASICFHNVDESQRGLPLSLNFSILMPSELRFYEDTWIGNLWMVNKVFNTVPDAIVESENSSYSSFVREGFISLQYYLCAQYLHIASGNATIPTVILRELKMGTDINELIAEGVDTSVLVILIGFMFPVTVFTKEIVEERELSLYFTLNNNKRGARIQFIVWYIDGVCQLLIACVIFTVVLKVKWIGGHSVFEHCPWYIMFMFFSSYILAGVAFSMLMAVIIRTTKMVVATVPIYWLLATLPLLSGESLETTWTHYIFSFSRTMLCNVTMCRGLRRILCLENYERGEQRESGWSAKDYLMSTLTGNDPSLLMCICYFYIQTLVYLLLALVLDGNLMPCIHYGITCKPCEEVLTRLIWYLRRRRRRLKREEEETAELNASRSRRISESADVQEKVTEVIDLYEANRRSHKQASITMDYQSRTTRAGVAKKKSSRSKSLESSSSSSINISRNRAESNVPDKELMVWFSNEELQVKGPKVHDTTKFFLETASLIEPEDDMDSESADLSVDETRRVVIEFKNVWKKYIQFFVVRNFSLKVYEKEMMVILGHNGSGKTTLLNMLCGKIKATTGKISINGFDVNKQGAKAYEQVGVSLHNLDGFKDFTVFEQLVYFCRLRGLSIENSNHDALLYLTSVDMQDYKDKPIRHLTRGQHRLTMVMCAFAGRTSVVLLDKPLEGIDSHRRRLFYRFALGEKRYRTIFITTNIATVASTLGDRISIFVNGRLYVCAPERILLKVNMNAIHVICYFSEQCNFDELFKHFARHIPSIELELRMGDSAIFLVDYIDLKRLLELMKGLSTIRKDLGLDSYQVKTPGVDIILLKAMQRTGRDTRGIYNPEILFDLAREIRNNKERHRTTKYGRIKAHITAIIVHVKVVLRKRFLMDLRDYAMPLVQIFLPSLLSAWTLIMPHLTEERRMLPINTFTMNSFQNTITLIKRTLTLDPLLAASKHYIRQTNMESSQKVIEIDEQDKFRDYIRKYMINHHQITDLNFIVAAYFTDDNIVAIFNGNLKDSPTLSLNLVMDALAVGFVNPSAGINVRMEYLPFSTLHTVYLNVGMNCLDWVLVIMICLCFCYAWALPLLNFGQGRNTPYSRIEMIAGMPFGTLSIASFLYGMFKVALSLIPLNAIILIFNNDFPWNSFDNYLFFYIIFIMGIYVISVDIVISNWLTEIRIGYIMITTIFSMGIIVYLTLYEMKGEAARKYCDKSILALHPFFSLVRDLMDRNHDSEVQTICVDEQTYETSVYLEHCEQTPNCCSSSTDEYLYMDHLWFTYLGILMIWVFLYARPLLHLTKNKPQNRRDKFYRGSDPDSHFDQNVLHFGTRSEPDRAWIKEKIQVRTMERPLVKHMALKVENLSVCFGSQIVLNHINFLVKRYQIIALVGLNSAGKTVLIKTLLGWLAHSTGTIINFGRHTSEYWVEEDYSHIGYCAQNNAIMDSLSVLEVIEFVLLIRQIKQLHQNAIAVLRIFDLYDSRFDLLPYCSRGILKRLNIALSMISYTGLILMDDPFAYLDELGLRSIYTLIEAQCRNGAAVLYTSTDPRFCDLANRSAILNPPSMCTIGDRHELQSKHYSAHFVVDAWIKTEMWKTINNEYRPFRIYFTEDDKTFERLCSIVEYIFPEAIIKRTTNHYIIFWLSCKTYPMTYILEVLHMHKQLIYSFTISTPSIRSVFDTILNAPKRVSEVVEDEDF